MYLYFLRHGIAADRNDPQYNDDSLRPLTEKGKTKMHSEALGMQALGLKFDAILSSPYLRAKQTAEIVAQRHKIKNKEIHFTKNLLPPASIAQLLEEANTLFSKSQNILLVGHEPHLTGMISCLLKSPEGLDIDLKKGGLCGLTLQNWAAKSAVLNWLLTPKHLLAQTKP